MNIWITSDTHFGHDNIRKYCNRPHFFEKKIFDNFIKYIKEGDLLIHLGDVSFGDHLLMHNEYIKKLKCKKWLIRGNHDRNTYQWYLNYWDFIAESIIFKYYGKKILFTHKPQEKHDYDINIYGHLHNNTHENDLYDKGFLISIEHLNYRPITLKQCIVLFDKGEKYGYF